MSESGGVRGEEDLGHLSDDGDDPDGIDPDGNPFKRNFTGSKVFDYNPYMSAFKMVEPAGNAGDDDSGELAGE